MANIVISEFADEKILAEAFDGLDVLYDPTLVDNREALIAEVGEAKALIVRNRTQVDKALLESAKNLQVVGRLGVGLDNIDVQACEVSGVKVCPARGANDLSVAEYVITSVLTLLRGAWFSTERMINGEWPRTEMIGNEASAKQIGLVGFGSNARETARHAKALGMNVAACDPYLPADDPAWEFAKSVDLKSLLRDSDVISMHTPLTKETRHLVDAKMIASMKSGAILINVSRGGIVDEKALVDALLSGHLAGAALDVFENEPLNVENGKLFRDVPNLILTPHIAGVTKESNIRVSRVTTQNVLDNLS